MGCCKIDRSRRSRNVEIRILSVAGFYRLLEDVDFVHAIRKILIAWHKATKRGRDWVIPKVNITAAVRSTKLVTAVYVRNAIGSSRAQ